MAKYKTCKGCHDYVDGLGYYWCRHTGIQYDPDEEEPRRCKNYRLLEIGNCIICGKSDSKLFEDDGRGPFCKECWDEDTRKMCEEDIWSMHWNS